MLGSGSGSGTGSGPDSGSSTATHRSVSAFASQASAQAYSDANPKTHLDADNDGVARETPSSVERQRGAGPASERSSELLPLPRRPLKIGPAETGRSFCTSPSDALGHGWVVDDSRRSRATLRFQPRSRFSSTSGPDDAFDRSLNKPWRRRPRERDGGRNRGLGPGAADHRFRTRLG